MFFYATKKFEKTEKQTRCNFALRVKSSVRKVSVSTCENEEVKKYCKKTTPSLFLQLSILYSMANK